MKVQIELPPKLIPVFLGKARYRGAYGGRGSAKTRSFALMTAVRAYQFAQMGQSGVILCGREFMNSLEDSSMQEIKQAIGDVPWLDDYFDVGEKYIRTKNRQVSYVFTGLRHKAVAVPLISGFTKHAMIRLLSLIIKTIRFSLRCLMLSGWLTVNALMMRRINGYGKGLILR